MKRFLSLLILITSAIFGTYGQTFEESLENATKPEEVVLKPEIDSLFYRALMDPTYGIVLYENLNYMLGGDSTRMDRKGYAARGWIEDFYPGGGVLHRGYYADGHLKIYKNHYLDGTVERSYRTLDNHRSTMETFYADGTLKSKVMYQEGAPVVWEDYYPSGKLEYMEEFNKTLDYYLEKKSFHTNGSLDKSLLLVKESKLLYESRQFNDSGILMLEGRMVFDSGEFDYLKIGKWSVYNATGKLVKEQFYVDGKLNKERSL